MRPIDADKLLARYKVRCVDCEQTQDYCKYLCDLADVISDIEGAPTIESPEQKWISCSERLPESREMVLISTELGIYVAWTTDDGLNLWHTATIPFSGEEVFAWMPLPEPHKEEKDNGIV